MHPGLELFNRAPVAATETALLRCCASPLWARRVAAHRPYPDLDALLAAVDEASYDLPLADRTAALAAEEPPRPGHGDTPRAALTALSAAHCAYESRFGHAFVISLAGVRPSEQLDHTLSELRARLANEPEDERVLAAEELRELARTRVTRLVQKFPEQQERQDRQGRQERQTLQALHAAQEVHTVQTAQAAGKAGKARQAPDSGQPDSPYVAV
ncbi:2-oxo-4-hydroxy-4-carboxy-5-ureidoimidazoline decarboxylase [Streptomyces apocyni]|uniref:2-oxo-4-hydroxy-4-carboxy-5-ureidoimidazoline decarboxylase n=1 Tax=Streptomyces apocyni TaxID=2654677 RepID=UPI001E64A9EB|nr:2-oxo-4-hydroxy-4-carboxy-5-ureidoimidazoline decarboxylase [Streptomyces apocyni]